MMKKIVAITLALVMMIQPMIASAATWSSIMTAIRTNSSGSVGDANLSMNGNEATISGNVEFDASVTYSQYQYIFDNVTGDILVVGAHDGIVNVTVNGGTYEGMIVRAGEDEGATGHAVVSSSAQVNGDVEVFTQDGGRVNYTNSGEVTGGVQLDARENSSIVMENTGKVTGNYVETMEDENGNPDDVPMGGVWGMARGDNSRISVTNDSEITEGVTVSSHGEAAQTDVMNLGTAGEMNVNAGDGGRTILLNFGTVGDVWGGADDGALVVSNTSEDSQSGYINVSGGNGSRVNVANAGTVNGNMNVDAYDQGSSAYVENAGKTEGMHVISGNGAQATVTNLEGAEVTNMALVQSKFGGSTEFTNSGDVNLAVAKATEDSETSIKNDGGTIAEPMASIEFYTNGDLSSIPSNEELTKMAGQAITYTGIETEDNTITLEILLYNENGELITRDGKVIPPELENELIEYIGVDLSLFAEKEEAPEEPEEEPYDDLKAQREAEEALRQARGIGGVTTSIFWNKQMYLGHSTYNGRVYYQGKTEMTKQSLSWLPGGSVNGKDYTLRINKENVNPGDVEIRLAQDILDVCKRAGIVQITIVDKNLAPIAQYAVSDLMAAREMYGLAADELICISADMNAEVMKVTAEGEYLPIEPAAEEAAQ